MKRLTLCFLILGQLTLGALCYAQSAQEEEAATTAETQQLQQASQTQQTQREPLTAEDQNEFFLVQLPQENQILTQDVLAIKGLNRTLSPVFVEDRLLDVREDGRFYGEITIKTPGKRIIPFSVVTPEFQVKTIYKKVLRLRQPSDLAKFTVNKQVYVYSYNVPFLYNPNSTRALSDPFTRADLAFFIAKIKGLQVQTTPPKDKSTDTHWGNDYIRVVVAKGYMSDFPDGSLKPTLQITTAEYIMSLVKALEVELDFSQTPLTYTDYNSTHWTSKFVRTAKNHQLIPSSGTLEFDRLMSVANFYDLAIRTSQLSKAVDQLLDFNVGYVVPKEFKQEQQPSISAFVKEYRQAIDSTKQLTIEYPVDKSVLLTKNVTVEGQIFPAEIFVVGGKIVTPDVDGVFMVPLSLNWGKNTFDIVYSKKVQPYTLFALQPYSDLRDHWVSETAARLRFAGFLEDTPLFNPKERLTRGSFSVLLVKAFVLEKQGGILQVPADVSTNSPQLESILTVMSLDLLKGDQQGFHPTREITKLEALAALVRVSQEITPTNKLPAVPFKDIPKTHWGYAIVQKALAMELISDGPYFYPSKIITKAEYAAMLYRVPQIKKAVEAQ